MTAREEPDWDLGPASDEQVMDLRPCECSEPGYCPGHWSIYLSEPEPEAGQ
jgi:hypothetical protein